jgi:hypothetical protein
MGLDIMKQIQNTDPVLKYTLPDVTVKSTKPSWYGSHHVNSRLINNDTGEITYVRDPGNDYVLKRTVTPHKTEEDIRRYTKAPASVNDIDFINNMGLKTNDINLIDNKINTPFNVARFLFEPHVDSHRIEAEGLIPKGTEQSKDQYRNNMLASVYKYYMLKNNGDRDLAWNDAQKFAKKEIDPLLEGSVYNNRFSPNKPDYNTPGGSTLTSIVDNDYLNNLIDSKLTKQFNPNLISDIERRKQMPDSEIKNYAIDWLTKYKKMPLNEAEMYYKSLEDNANKRYEENYPLFEREYGKPVSNLINIMKK